MLRLLAVMRDLGALVSDIEAIAAQFPGALGELEAVAADVMDIARNRDLADVEKFVGDLRVAWNAALNGYASAQEQIAAFLADARKLIADLKG